RRAVVLPPDRRPRRPGDLRRDEAAAAGRPAGGDAARARRTPDAPTRPPRHERRLQVLPRRWDVAPDPGKRHGAARPRLHGGDLGRAARGDARGRGATGWGHVTDAPRRVDKPWGHELIWIVTDRYVGKRTGIDAG